MGKRANVKAATPAPAKKGKVDPAFATVMEAVTEAEQLPNRVREMLVEMMPYSLKFASDERHELQSMAVDMVDETMNGKKSALEATVANEDNALSTLKASESNLGTTVETSEAALTAQKDVVQAKKSALGEAAVAAKASAAELKTQRTDDKAAREKLTTMEKEKVAIESAFAEHFKPMEEGEAKAHLKKLEPFLKKIDIESTLLTALPSSVSKKKEARGTFDHLVLQELDKAFNAKIAGLGASIEAEGPASVQREAALRTAEQDSEAKALVQTQAAAELEAAEKELSDREAALSTAKQAVDDFLPQVEEVTKRLSDARTAAAEFEAGPFTNFVSFKTRVAALPVEEAPEEPAPAEEAPAEAEVAAS